MTRAPPQVRVQQRERVASCRREGQSLVKLLQTSGDAEGVGTSGDTAYNRKGCSNNDSGKVDDEEDASGTRENTRWVK